MKGFNQRLDIDYRETFSLVIKLTIVRLILSLALSNGWSLKQLDVNNVFLHMHLLKDVYMSQPSNFVDKSNLTHVCHFKNILYSLKQAHHALYH